MFKTKKKFLVAFLSLIVGAQYSCKKDTTEPTDNLTATEQMYSIGAKSVTADIIPTSDGGYLMVGTSYASNNVEGDIVAIKTDARGLQEWSTLMGKSSGTGTGSLAGQTVKYDEEGVKVAEEADGSFTIAGNRTYVAYSNITANSGSGIPKQSKVVLYQLSSAGTATTSDGVELRSNTEFTEKVSDFKIDASSGTSQYILTGYTTDVKTNKPADSNNGTYDLTDIFTASLDASFNALWINSSTTYGFPGQDYGTSIQVIDNGYLVIGTTEQFVSGTTYSSTFIAVLFEKAGGTPVNEKEFGDQSYEIEGGYSVYDATNEQVTIVGSITGGTSGYTGQLVTFQLDVDGSNFQLSAINTNTFGFEFIKPTAPSSTSTGNTFKARSIALIPNNGGFAISSTLSDNSGKNICITKLENDFSLPATGWPHYYGTTSSISTSQNLAGPVIPMLDANGAEEYVYTGTFNANTFTSQIGWVSF
jgi:hypothetical protein